MFLILSLAGCSKTRRVTDQADVLPDTDTSIRESVEAGLDAYANREHDGSMFDGALHAGDTGIDIEESINCFFGFELDDNGDCVPINTCDQDQNTCDNEPNACYVGGFGLGGPAICRCPLGYTGDGQGEQGCVPVLDSLGVFPGVLELGFDSEILVYSVDVAVTEETIVLTPSAQPGITIEVEEIEIATGSSTLPFPLDLGVNQLRVKVTSGNASRTYQITVNRGLSVLRQHYLKASNTDAEDRFGFSVSLYGDTLAVGAIGEASNATGINGDQDNNDAPESGAVYIFTRNETSWSQQAYLKASNTDDGDNFGYVVSLHGDTLAVAAYSEDSSATGVDGSANNNDAPESGAVYIFVRNGAVWSQQAYLKASNTDSEDAFGNAISLYGDTLAVGAYQEDGNYEGNDGEEDSNEALQSGAVYIFARTGTTWSQQAYLKASNSEANDEFGISVSLYGDTLSVGAIGEDSSARGINGDQNNNDAAASGAVYVFTRNNTRWGQQAYLKASNTDATDWFGSSVSLYGDTLAVGAYGEDSDAMGVDGDQDNNEISESGAVYIFTHDDTSWTQQAYLKTSNSKPRMSGGEYTDPGGQFGFGVFLSGETLAVSEPQKSYYSGSGRGSVDLFVRQGSRWIFQKNLSGEIFGDFGFGRAVSFDAETLAVGVLFDSSGATGIDGERYGRDAEYSGAVYIYGVLKMW